MWHVINIYKQMGDEQQAEVYLDMRSDLYLNETGICVPSSSLTSKFNMNRLLHMVKGKASNLLETSIFPELSHMKNTPRPSAGRIDDGRTSSQYAIYVAKH